MYRLASLTLLCCIFTVDNASGDRDIRQWGGETDKAFIDDVDGTIMILDSSNQVFVFECYDDATEPFEGVFDGHAWHENPRIAFGDAIIGRSSLSEWDFVEVAVIPEPSGLGALVELGFARLCARSL